MNQHNTPTSPVPQQQNQKQDFKDQREELGHQDQCCGGTSCGGTQPAQQHGKANPQQGSQNLNQAGQQTAHHAERSTSR